MQESRNQGERNPGHKLKRSDVLAIRALRRQGVTLAEIGEMFGVTKTNVWIICANRGWKHLT